MHIRINSTSKNFFNILASRIPSFKRTPTTTSTTLRVRNPGPKPPSSCTTRAEAQIRNTTGRTQRGRCLRVGNHSNICVQRAFRQTPSSSTLVKKCARAHQTTGQEGLSIPSNPSHPNHQQQQSCDGLHQHGQYQLKVGDQLRTAKKGRQAFRNSSSIRETPGVRQG